MQREVGGGIGMGNTCKSMAVSFQCMTKSTTNKNNNNNNNNKQVRLSVLDLAKLEGCKDYLFQTFRESSQLELFMREKRQIP